MRTQIFTDIRLRSERLRAIFIEVLKAYPEYMVRPSHSAGPVDLLILDLDENNPSATFALVRNTVKTSPSTQILLTSTSADAQVLLEALRAGVKEFLPSPFSAEEAKQALCRIKERAGDGHSGHEPRGRVISILGAKGGVGTTSVAANLGCALQLIDRGKSVVLVDLDAMSSDLPMFLDLQPAHGLKDIAEDYARIDKVFLMNLISTHDSRIHLLASGYEDPTGRSLSPEAVAHTMTLLRVLFDYVVVDCGMMVDETILGALNISSTVLVVSSIQVPVIRSTRRLLDKLKQCGHPTQKIKVVMNRYDQKVADLLKNTESALQHKIFAFIPEEFDRASRAINNGWPLVLSSQTDSIAQAYQRLAASFLDGAGDHKSSMFSSYFKLLRNKWSRKPVGATASE